MKATVYTKPMCGYCISAKNLLKSKGIEYEERYLDNPQVIREFVEQHPTKRTMPQIWIDNEYVGGFKELKEKLS
jgi:glutaredoxin 3|tara:strand:- start:1444 stop:1665 length:222 start_codon:yes stop_codon:yes gene_type:complete